MVAMSTTEWASCVQYGVYCRVGKLCAVNGSDVYCRVGKTVCSESSDVYCRVGNILPMNAGEVVLQGKQQTSYPALELT